MTEEWSEATFGDRWRVGDRAGTAGAPDPAADGAEATGGGASEPLGRLDDDLLGHDVPSEFDAIEEVDAVVRSLRRAAVEYGLLFLALLLAPPLLARLAPPWFTRPVWGGITPNFLAVALLLYVAFIAIAAAYTRFAEHVEDEMLGRHGVEEGFDA